MNQSALESFTRPRYGHRRSEASEPHGWRGSIGVVTRLVVVAILVLCVGCSASPASVSSPSTIDSSAKPSQSATPTEAADAKGRTACATRVLEELIRAFNSGDTLALERTIGAGPLATQSFQWVSMSTSSEFGPTLRGPGLNEVEYTPEGARRILLRHSAQGERWTLVAVRAGDGPSWHGGVDAEVHVERKLANGQIVKTGGKTALSCVGSVIYVLSLGDE